MARMYNLTTVSQTGQTATTQFEGRAQAERLVGAATEDPKLRYILLVEVMESGELEVVKEIWAPPERTLVNGLGVQAVVRGDKWEIRTKYETHKFPSRMSVETVLSQFLSTLTHHGGDCYREGVADGRAKHQAELRQLIGAAPVARESGETR